jgi:hypothetical protein
MSIKTALNNIRLEPSARWAHTEYSLGYHLEYMAKHTGLSSKDPELVRNGCDHFHFDFNWSTDDGIIDWKKAGRATDMGHAAYATDGSDQRALWPWATICHRIFLSRCWIAISSIFCPC